MNMSIKWTWYNQIIHFFWNLNLTIKNKQSKVQEKRRTFEIRLQVNFQPVSHDQ